MLQEALDLTPEDAPEFADREDLLTEIERSLDDGGSQPEADREETLRALQFADNNRTQPQRVLVEMLQRVQIPVSNGLEWSYAPIVSNYMQCGHYRHSILVDVLSGTCSQC